MEQTRPPNKPKADPAHVAGMTAKFNEGLKRCIEAGSDTFAFDLPTNEPAMCVVLIRPTVLALPMMEAIKQAADAAADEQQQSAEGPGQ